MKLEMQSESKAPWRKLWDYERRRKVKKKSIIHTLRKITEDDLLIMQEQDIIRAFRREKIYLDIICVHIYESKKLNSTVRN